MSVDKALKRTQIYKIIKKVMEVKLAVVTRHLNAKRQVRNWVFVTDIAVKVKVIGVSVSGTC
jgi:hypothetical protein